MSLWKRSKEGTDVTMKRSKEGTDVTMEEVKRRN